MQLDVVFADASAGAGALHFMNVDADFAGKTANMRSRRNRFAMFGARNFAQLQSAC